MNSAQNSQDLPQAARHAETSRSPSTVERRILPHNAIIFREIHKNAWLKKLPPAERKPSIGAKKGERVWVVFCVHDDSEAFLEIYPDQRVAVAHRPEISYSLGGCRHVSPTICPQGGEGEFEFVITLPTDHVRLVAPTWEMMMEWVDTIQAKLREMKILSPKENLYSRMPECRSPAGPLAPTRDPNSPLPPRPNGPMSTTAGLESQARVPTVIPDSAVPQTITEEDYFTPQEPPSDVRVQVNAATTSLYITQSEPPVYSRSTRPVCRTSSTSTPSVNDNEQISSSQTPNITIIEVSAAAGENGQANSSSFPSVSSSGITTIFNFSQMQAASQVSENEEEVRQSLSSSQESSNRQQVVLNGDSPEIAVNSIPTAGNREPPLYATPLRRLHGRRAHVGAPPRPSNGNSQFHSIPQGREGSSEQEVPPSMPRSQFYVQNVEGVVPARTEESPGATAGSEDSSERSLYERVFVPISFPIPPPPPQEWVNQVRGRGRTASETGEGVEEGNRNAGSMESPNPTVEGSGRIVQGSNGSQVGATTERRPLLPPPQPYRHLGQSIAEASSVPGASGLRLTLREQQVLQLRKEMSHPGGVRLQLRRKDCVGSIALVDALGSVWVAGWKQKEHPMLYNVLRFGDQLLSVCGVRILSATDAQRLIRGATGLYVELLIRRVPFGRVFAVRRDIPVESGNAAEALGLVLEGGTAEIKSVEPCGPAARAGLSAKAPTADGLSLCPWVLTEVNSRPLNPFFHDGEPAIRLGAVGGEVSILVQPSDLARRIRKQLKSLRSYKDFIVQ